MKERFFAFFAEHKTSIGFVSVMIVTILGISIYNLTTHVPATAAEGCSLETKQCADGSQVGRGGPQCEFAPCPETLTANEAASLQLGTFTGELPCADCEKIQNTLILTRQAPSTENGTFSLQETFVGKGNSFRVTSGNWQLIRGSQHHANAEIYQLNVDSQKAFRYFLKVDENTLLQLNNDQTRINSTQNYTLKK